MRKRTRIIIVASIGLMIIGSAVAAGYFLTQTNWFKARILFDRFRNRPAESLTSTQKVIVLMGHCRNKDIRAAIVTYSDLSKIIPALTKYERLSIANHYGTLLRESGQGVDELYLYGDLFRDEYPAYYHLYLAQAYGKRGEYSKRRAELTLAYRDARRANDPEVLALIEKIFRETTLTA